MNIKELRELSFELTKIDDVLQKVLGLEPISKEKFQQEHDRIQAEWYAPIDVTVGAGEQAYNYGVYSDPMYPYLMLDCFKGWSRGNAVNVAVFFEAIKKRMNGKIESVLDVFAGLGQTSVLLAKAFPDSQILLHGTDPAQVKVAKALIKKFNAPNVKVVSKPKPATVVFAMEAMEHLIDPIAFIKPILSSDTCKYYVDGSSFTIDSIGHFPIYMDGDFQIERTEYKRFYFDAIGKLGFHRSFNRKHWVHKRFYNGRPNIFVREGAVKPLITG